MKQKKLLSMFLAVCMMLALLPAAAIYRYSAADAFIAAH